MGRAAASTTEELIERAEHSCLKNYRPLPVVIDHGKGARLYGKDGKEYIDFVGGIAVSCLGYDHQPLIQAVQEQAAKVMHTSNIFWNEPAVTLAEKLTTNSFADRVFFANSGAEANEAMLKLARKYFHDRGEGRFEIIAMDRSFHGRTMATVTCTGQEKYRVGFEPLLPGVRHVPFGDLAALESAITERTAAVLLEPIQGEGGLRMPAPGYLAEVRQLCSKHGVLMLLDEVQSGVGRTGTLFAYEQEGFEPDAMSLAKGIGGGMPLAAMLTKEDIGACLTYGSHGSTYGGNPVACAAGNVVIDTVKEPAFLQRVQQAGARVLAGFDALAKKHRRVAREARGRGLWCGLELTVDGSNLAKEAIQRGLVLNCIGGRVIRAAPPLVITDEEIDKALEIIDGLLTDLARA